MYAINYNINVLVANAQLLIAPKYLKLENKQNYNTYTIQPPNGNNISAITMNQSTTFDNIIEAKPKQNNVKPIIIIVSKLIFYNIFPNTNKCNKNPVIANTHNAKMYPKSSYFYYFISFYSNH